MPLPIVGIAARIGAGVAAKAAAKRGVTGRVGQAAARMGGAAIGGRVASLAMGRRDGEPKQFRGTDLTEFRGY